MSIFLGVDPGMSGGLAVLGFEKPLLFPFRDRTEKDISDLFKGFACADAFCMIESVHSFPGQGVSSSFSFGRNFGLLLGSLYVSGIPFELISPQKWQKSLNCMTGGDKNVTKTLAQRLYPAEKITHAVADCLLLAHYCKMTRGGR